MSAHHGPFIANVHFIRHCFIHMNPKNVLCSMIVNSIETRNRVQLPWLNGTKQMWQLYYWSQTSRLNKYKKKNGRRRRRRSYQTDTYGKLANNKPTNAKNKAGVHQFGTSIENDQFIDQLWIVYLLHAECIQFVHISWHFTFISFYINLIRNNTNNMF